MLSHLLDVSVRSLVLALAAFGVLWIAGRRRTAALQHAVYATVVCGMLALFVFGGVLPRLPLRILNGPQATPNSSRAASASRPWFGGYFLDQTPTALTPASPHARAIRWQDLALYAYFAGAFTFLARFAVGLFLARRLLATAHPIPLGDGNLYQSAAIAVPVALGSKILLPIEWRDWDRAKLDAVLAHENAHVRRHDGFIAAFTGLNRSLFWFHPLAWFLERRLTVFADQACDDSCIAELGDPDRYARLLLEMASVVGGSHGRLRGPLMTMAASHIRQRVDAILAERRSFSRGLSRTAWISVLFSAIPVVLFAGVAKLDHQPAPESIEMPRPAAPPPPLLESRRAPVQIAHNQTPQTTGPPAALPTPIPRFDDVSVKPCEAGDGAGRSGRGGAQGRGIPISPPGEIYIHCLSVSEILNIAVDSGDVKLLNDPGGPNDPQRVQGGAPWIYTDLWTIDAKTNDPVARQWTFPGSSDQSKTFKGAMMLAMTEDKFHLQTHRKLEEVPMYSLTLAPGGSKLQLTGEDGCIRIDTSAPHAVSDFAPVNGKRVCTWHTAWSGPNWTIDAADIPMAALANVLSGLIVQRPVLDKTALTGRYTFQIKFAHDQNAPGRFSFGMNPFTAPTPDDPLAPTLNTVLGQELGLTLVEDKGPREFLVIDGAQRPE